MKGKFCPLLGAFAGFPNVSEKKTIKESRANPSQYSELLEAKGKDGKGRARMEKVGPLTFYSICVLWSAFHFGFVNCKIKNTKNEKQKQIMKDGKERKKKRETFYPQTRPCLMNVISETTYIARIFQTNYCHHPQKEPA